MGYSNGRLPQSALAPITKAVNGQQAYLAKDAARAFMAMNAESERRFGVTLRVASARVAYRPLADQQYFWNLYLSGHGALAARPGTSNHGWGLAVDLASPLMRRIVDQIGEKYGFAKKWSDAPTEWWHIKWRPGNYRAVEKHHSKYPVLKRGAKGLAVLRLKRLLYKKGIRNFSGPHSSNRFDRHFGAATQEAVKRFQKKVGLKPDGVVGPVTWRKLRK